MSTPAVISMNSLMGYKVQNAAGEDLGRVEELVIDQTNGRILYSVLSSGGFLGIGNRLIAIPWSALQLNSFDKRFLLNVDKETLRNAPSFDRNHWPDLSSREWNDQVSTYFAYNPASETVGTERSVGQRHVNVNESRTRGLEEALKPVEPSEEDEKLARRVEFELYSTRAFNLDEIQVTANNGSVALNGRVSSRAESILASNTAKAVDGVRSVTNNLKVSKVA